MEEEFSSREEWLASIDKWMIAHGANEKSRALAQKYPPGTNIIVESDRTDAPPMLWVVGVADGNCDNCGETHNSLLMVSPVDPHNDYEGARKAQFMIDPAELEEKLAQ